MTNSKKWLYILTAFWLCLVLGIGAWWLYLAKELGKIVDGEQSSIYIKNISYMLKWEGYTFFIVFFLLTLSIAYIYFQDWKKTKALQTFFASITHELKTPLATMLMQAEVINEQSQLKNDPQLEQHSSKLNQSILKFEEQLNKLLQLSRLERGGKLHLTPVNFKRFINHIIKEFKSQTEISIDTSELANLDIWADEMALEIIFKNLLRNTIEHCQNISPKTSITFAIIKNQLVINYSDNGLPFKGDKNKLGTLFYKFNSNRGTGIGLYLSQLLMNKMSGKFEILDNEHLSFKLTFNIVSDFNE